MKNALHLIILTIFRCVQKHPGVTFILTGVVLIIPLLIYDFISGMTIGDLSKNLTPSLIEVFFLGFCVIGYNKLSERKREKKRFEDEIESYRPWREKEATYRIVGLIRSMNKLEETTIKLGGCFLPDVELWDVNLEGSDMKGVNLEGAILGRTNLKDVDLTMANLKEVNLMDVFLTNAVMKDVKLDGAILMGVDLEGVNLEGAYVDCLNWITKLNDWKCTGVEYIEKKYSIYAVDENGKPAYRVESKKVS